MEFFSSFFNFILADTKKLSARAITILTIVLVVFFIDNLTGFSYYYTLEKKLNVIELANKTMSDSTLSKADKLFLSQLRTEAIKHKSLEEKALNFLRHSSIQLETDNSEVFRMSKILYYLDILTATCIPILLMLTGLYQIIPKFFEKKKKTVFDDSKFIIFLKLFAVEGLFYIAAIIQAKTLLTIPILYNSIYWNFTLNISINIFILLVVYYFADVLPKKRAKKKTL